MERKDYESEAEGKIEEWNARIEQLKSYTQVAGPEKSKEYEEETATLIVNRESVRRGLLPLSKSGESLCSSCSDEPTPSEKTEPVEESILDMIAPEPYDVGSSPKRTYGKGD